MDCPTCEKLKAELATADGAYNAALLDFRNSPAHNYRETKCALDNAVMDCDVARALLEKHRSIHAKAN